MPLIFVTYHGEVQIELWEYLMSMIIIMVMYIIFGRKKRMNVKLHPEYKYYMSGLLAKMLGGAFFALIYFYYYGGGDTINYYYSGVSMKHMLFVDPLEYLRQVVLGDHSARALSAYAMEPVRPLQFIFFDGRTFQMARISSVLAILTFNSYLLSTLLIAGLSFFGVWAGYRTFVSYFPRIANRLAIGFLFMPSAIFWGSGILKDTVTFSAACAWVFAIDELFFKRRNEVSSTVLALLCATAMILVKPYVLMVLIPATLLWLFYMRVIGLRNVLVRFVVIPVMGIGLVALSIFVLTRMGDMLDKFALDEALTSISSLQHDMSTNQDYGDFKFSLGEFDGTWWGVVKKFPIATNAALFRPYPWEVRNAVTALSGLENLFVLGLTLYVLVRAGVRFTLGCIGANPLLLMSISFALLFSFVVGITTPNFGALVRFKIPMLPFYISSLYIILFFHRERRIARNAGKRFDFSAYRMGDWKGQLALRRKAEERPGGNTRKAPGRGFART